MTRLHKPLINSIHEVLEADSRVVAVWLEGSIARGEDDDFSDIDLWIMVKDSAFRSFIDEREQFAAKLGPVVSVLYPKTPDQIEGIDSFRIFLEGQSPTLTIDVDVQHESRKFFFTKDSIAEECHVLFDRGKGIKWRPFQPDVVEEYARGVFTDISVRFWHQLPKLYVTLERHDSVEALHWYMELLEYYVTLFRIMYAPEKIDWGFKDVEYDLPEDAIAAIEDCWPPDDVKHLRKKTARLAHRFWKQSKIVSVRLRIPVSKELRDYVMQLF